ncbi:unnamed protein product [Symbiodinium sp. CCMP2456]|nr:unnamed protein product [Symbiodinium sp. CCMP2456]
MDSPILQAGKHYEEDQFEQSGWELVSSLGNLSGSPRFEITWRAVGIMVLTAFIVGVCIILLVLACQGEVSKHIPADLQSKQDMWCLCGGSELNAQNVDESVSKYVFGPMRAVLACCREYQTAIFDAEQDECMKDVQGCVDLADPTMQHHELFWNTDQWMPTQQCLTNICPNLAPYCTAPEDDLKFQGARLNCIL